MIARPIPIRRRGRRIRAVQGRRGSSSRLTFSLSIVSERPLVALAGFERRWPRRRDEGDEAARLGGNHLYGIGRFSVEETDWATRADLVDAGISGVLERLDATGIGLGELNRADVYVRAYFTLPPGAETIRADTLERLSAINATLWLDA